MKKTAIVAALLCLIASNVASAGEKADARDPCAVFLCMAGKVYGQSPGECSGAVKKFFSINAFRKINHFNPGKTFDMRRAFLAQCASADPAHVSKILSKFGRIRG